MYTCLCVCVRASQRIEFESYRIYLVLSKTDTWSDTEDRIYIYNSFNAYDSHQRVEYIQLSRRKVYAVENREERGERRETVFRDRVKERNENGGGVVTSRLCRGNKRAAGKKGEILLACIYTYIHMPYGTKNGTRKKERKEGRETIRRRTDTDFLNYYFVLRPVASVRVLSGRVLLLSCDLEILGSRTTSSSLETRHGQRRFFHSHSFPRPSLVPPPSDQYLDK